MVVECAVVCGAEASGVGMPGGPVGGLLCSTDDEARGGVLSGPPPFFEH